MAVSLAIGMCSPPYELALNEQEEKVWLHKPGCINRTASYADWAVALTLFIVGVIAAAGAMNVPPAAAYTLVSTGSVYSLFMLCDCIGHFRQKCIKKLLGES